MRDGERVDIKTNQEPHSANPLKTCRFRPIESLEIDHSALDAAMWSMVEFERIAVAVDH